MQPQYSEEVIVFFIAANIIVAVFAVFFFFILRIQQKRKQIYQKQLLEKEFKTREESFLQISRDLHDDIGSSLSGINMLSQLALQELTHSNNVTANELLQKINHYTSEVIEKVSDMAWLLKPSQESLLILVNKLKAYSLGPAQAKSITMHFDHNPDIYAKELSVQQRKTIYLISKEIINNAVKYSACKNIYYSIHSSVKTIKLSIKDDGNGFSVANVTWGNGLNNIKTRAAEIEALLRINSEDGAGTSIELEL